MPVSSLQPDQNLGLRRGDAVVCIPVFGAYELFTQCVGSVLAHTDPGTPILICDDASPDPKLERFVREVVEEGGWPHRVHYLRRAVNGGFVEAVNAGFAVADPADVVILNSDCIVSEGWLDGLREAVEGDARNATATALTNAGTIVTVPRRNHPRAALPPELTVDAVAAAIRGTSLRLHPDLPTCVGHCVYVRRSALELVGGLDTAFSPGYEEEADFSQRCLVRGLRHVLADDVFVYHRSAGSFGGAEATERLRWDHHVLLASRYPYYDDWIEEVRADRHSRLARSLAAGGRAFGRASVTIDGRCLTSYVTGTASATLELIAALDRHTQLRLRVLVPDDVDDYVSEVLSERPGIELLAERDALAGEIELTDVAHRPYQVAAPEDALLLRRLGSRLVMTQLDHIAWRNPAYFGTYDEWWRYRNLVAASLAAADQVVFISAHGAADARALELVDESRINVVALSVEQTLPESTAGTAGASASRLAAQLAGRPFLLCLGTDFMHKNRPFALRLLDALVAAGDFDGALVFAGLKVSAGSSAGEEAALLAARPHLARRVIDLGAVDETERRRLLAQCTAVVYPTVSEGFGLIPFQAAAAGVPCLFAWHTSLADQLPRELATLVPWNAEDSARQVAPLLTAGSERTNLVTAVQKVAAQLTAARQAEVHADIYARALAAPSPAAAKLGAETLELALQLGRVELELGRARRELGEIYDDPLSRGLAGRYAILPDELRRPVLAVASRPALRSAATTFYRIGHALRHRRRPPA